MSSAAPASGGLDHNRLQVGAGQGSPV